LFLAPSPCLTIHSSHSFSFHSFHTTKQKLQNDKSSAKTSLALVNAAIAENNRLRAQGVAIDPNLTPREVYDLAQGVVDQLVADVPEGHRFYVLTSYSARAEKEAWTCHTSRGNGTRLVTLLNRAPITSATTLENEFSWVCVPHLYTTNNANNMNMVEKATHWMLFSNPGSMWLDCGKGGVRQKEGELRNFSLTYIHGPPDGLEFAAVHRRTLSSNLVQQLNELRMAPQPPRTLPRSLAIQVDESESFSVDDATKPSAIKQVDRSTSLDADDDDDDGGGKPRAIKKQVTERTQAQRQPLGTLELTRPVVKPVAKVTLLDFWGDKIVGPNASRQVVVSRHVASPKASRPRKKRAGNTTKQRKMPKSPTFEEDYNDE
jgi:hypothetical protein